MHEFSMTEMVVKQVLASLAAHDVVRVERVDLLVGELTFLGEEQMKFAYDVLVKGTVLEGSTLEITHSPALVECPECGFRGPIKHEDNPAYHITSPVFSCPECGSRVEIISGKECTITGIRAEVDDDEGDAKEERMEV